MKLIHYSHDALVGPIKSYKQDEGRPVTRGDKPNGFWISVKGERDWPEFCYNERWNLESFKVAYEVHLKPDAHILKIQDSTSLRLFDKQYRSGVRLDTIAWHVVARQYSGIIIAPYCYDCRYDLQWYYPWDVASGCIWDSSVITVSEAAHEIPNWANQETQERQSA